MKNSITIFLIIFCMLAVSVAVQAQEKLVICGTGDSQELLRILAEDFEKSNPETKVEIPDSIGSGGGIKAAATGKCDLGRVARPIKEEEKKYGLNYLGFAKSPIVFVVHPSVTDIENLSPAQIIDIYTGKSKFWSQLGGPEKTKIYPVSREEGDSSNAVLVSKLEGFKDITRFISKRAYSSPEAVELMSGHKYTIGYGTLSMFIGTDMKTVGISEIKPSVENVRNGSYNLSLDYALVYRGMLSEPAKKFLDYLFTPEAKKIMLENGAFSYD